MKTRIKQLTASGSVLLLSILFAGFATPAGAQDNKPDPRLAGFEGKIDPAYDKSVQDWPKSIKFTGNEPNVLLFLLDDVGYVRWQSEHRPNHDGHILDLGDLRRWNRYGFAGIEGIQPRQ